MRVGLTYDLKESVQIDQTAPEDALEEYDYPATVEYIAKALESQGHRVVRLGGGREFLAGVLREKVDVVFNISEGRGTYRSREAQVPSVLEMLNIPYSGSDPLCLAICLEKSLTKEIVARAGVSTPRWFVLKDVKSLSTIKWEGFNFPAILKPAYEGSSKGIRNTSLASSLAQIKQIANKLWNCYRQPVMVEEFIQGDEVTVGMLGNFPPKVLGIMRILPRKQEKNFIYSVEVKRDWKALVDYECPAQLPLKVLEDVRVSSLKAFEVLGCRDFARIDFRIGADGVPYFIEINPLPGLGDYSDLVIMALKLGWTHEALIQAILGAALERYPLCVRR